MLLRICPKQARKQGGFEGVHSKPPFGHAQASYIKCPTVCSGPLASLSLNAVRTSLVAAVHPANRARKLHRCDERMRINTLVNNVALSGAQESTSRPSSGRPPTIKRKINRLESYHLSENAWKHTRYIWSGRWGGSLRGFARILQKIYTPPS